MVLQRSGSSEGHALAQSIIDPYREADPQMQYSLCAIAVMAKAPRSGRTKTRLVPPLSADQAAALGAAFLRDVTGNIAAAALHAAIRGYVAFAPAGSEAAFDGVIAPGTALVLADGTPPVPVGVEGLGRSLLHAARALFEQGFGSVCLLNADSPNLPTRALTRAAETLAAPGDRVVLGAAEDGGYYLLGMKAPHADLFREVDWSTERVAAQTRARARGLGLDLLELPVWYDVDDVTALRRLLGQQGSIDRIAGPAGTDDPGLVPFAAPATARCLARLDVARRLADHPPAGMMPPERPHAG